MAEEETAVVADEGAPVADPPVIEEQQDETPEAIAELASKIGWVPKDQFRGDPEAWKPADQFILDGREIQQTTARELRSVREQMERLSGVTETIIQDRVAAARSDWQRQYDEAFEAGDKDAANALLKQQPTVPANGGAPDPQVVEWVNRHPWYNADPLAQARANEISDRLKHLPVPEQLKQVERAIRKEYPEHFPKAKDPPATQTSASRNPNPSNRVKGYAQMPDEAQKLALDYEERLGVKKEDFAKSYWRNQEGVSR